MSAIRVVFFLTTCVGCVGVGGAEPRPRDQTVERDPAFQEQIRRVVTGSPADPAFFAEVQRLKEMARGPDGVRLLVRQAIIYSLEHPRLPEDQNPTPSALPTLRRWLGINPQVVAVAAFPLLEGDDNAVKAFVIDHVMGGVDRPQDIRSGLPDEYEFYLRGEREPPAGFVEVIYRSDPSAAIKALTHVYAKDLGERRALLWANHVIDDVIWKRRHGFLRNGEDALAIEQLDALAGSKQWWVRAYAADTLWRHEPLRREDLVKRLRADEHPIVRKLLTRPKQAAG